MNRSARLAVLVVSVLLLAVSAQASVDSWRVIVGADDGYGAGYAAGMQLGVYPTSVDGWDSQDREVYDRFFADYPGICIHVAAAIPGETEVYAKSIKSPTLESSVKIWDFYMAANINSTADAIRLYCRSFYQESILPPRTYAGMPAKYYVLMLDNKGVAGAPANGARWDVTLPTVFEPNMMIWTCPVNLPLIKLSQASNAALVAEGYKLRFVQEVVPEPSSLLALSGSLIGTLGMIRRRR